MELQVHWKYWTPWMISDLAIQYKYTNNSFQWVSVSSLSPAQPTETWEQRGMTLSEKWEEGVPREEPGAAVMMFMACSYFFLHFISGFVLKGGAAPTALYEGEERGLIVFHMSCRYWPAVFFVWVTPRVMTHPKCVLFCHPSVFHKNGVLDKVSLCWQRLYR